MDERRCTAKSKRSGQRCKRYAARGRRVCTMHGGKTPRGAASPHFLHGKYSKSIPVRYLNSMDEALKRPDLKNNRMQIALIEARMDELLQKLDTGEHGAAWRRMGELLATDAADEIPEPLQALLLRCVEDGLGEPQTWRELQGLIELRRKAVETDSKIKKLDETTMDAEQTMFLVGVIVSAAREFITDPEKLQEFAERVAMSTPGGVIAGQDGSVN